MTGRVAPALLLLLLPLTACGDDGEQTLTVLAAASLTETFTELAERFEDEHPEVDVELVFGSSATLAEQAVDGAPGQVLATADQASMSLAEESTSGTPESFASNRLTLVVPSDNPARIGALADLDDSTVDYVVCAAAAPCGAIAASVLGAGGISRPPASEEVDVKSVLARVVQGEADAGLVYRTDAFAAGDDVTEIEIPEADAFATTYFIAPLLTEDGDSGDLAGEFVTLVRSDEARDVFQQAGFGGVVRQ